MQDPAANFERPLFILGLPRSGTSLVAGLCKKSGFWVGTTVVADRNNPKGYFEHVEIREALIKQLLIELGCDPLGVRKLPEPDALQVSFNVKRKLAQVLKRDGYRADRPWLYKDAKMCLLWPLFHQAFPNANWLIVSRDTESFVDSCLRTNFMRQHSDSREFWYSLAEQYLQRLASLREVSSRVFELHSPDLFAGDYSKLERVLQAYGLIKNEAKLGKFINADHWHGKKTDASR
ncbi:MAG: sulfotransferase [Gammaproteobacteria bacterium]|nr:sulfotransferase [Gammaproteobacteria bacterium]MBT8152305.1 sulfotransferase [Gammaproteobacteria bacterium]NND38640.1 hypothetical protein [Pseudomonadales bacterium]NNM11718.1 hypothetical protein [Pseudomonadales bacterium]RZV56209.1 MAG: hypothetical protein EX270_05385 [Pseudomonadales bacterium]